MSTETPIPAPERPWQLLLLSAPTAPALEEATDQLAAWLEAHPEVPLADVAQTLQLSAAAPGPRRALVARDRDDALAALRSRDPRRLLGSLDHAGTAPSVAFLLAGLGDHYPGMCLGLYRHEPAFRADLDTAAALLQEEGIDLLGSLFPQGTGPEAEAALTGGGKTDLRAMLGRATPSTAAPGAPPPPPALHRTEIAQPAVFAVEHALARVLAEWGLRPSALVGYSLGEYVAACLAGVLSFPDALRLVARRARLIGGLPAGAMLSVALPEDEARRLVTGPLSLAAVNGPAFSVLAGPPDAVETLAAEMAARGIVTRRLPTTHAFHSRMMEPLRGELRALLATVRLEPPRIPYLSNVTGTWITPEQATDPETWVRHLVEPVRFGDALLELLAGRAHILVEVGPGQALSSLALQLAGTGSPITVPTVRPSFDRRQPDTAFLLSGLARLWLAGAAVDWPGFARHEPRQRASGLPVS